MTEIRSYRGVFDLERRIYAIDGIRLNPGGVPAKGVAYAVAALLGSVLIGRLPVVGPVLRLLPWYLREIALPFALGAASTMLRIEGRDLASAGRAVARQRTQPKSCAALRESRTIGGRWTPEALLTFDDGGGMRRVRYRGPGRVSLALEHERKGCREAHGVGLRAVWRPRRVVVRAGAAKIRGQRAEVLSLPRGTTLVFIPRRDRCR